MLYGESVALARLAMASTVFLLRSGYTVLRIAALQPSDTAYPRFKSRLSPTDTERAFYGTATRSPQTRLGFMLLLKSY
jgi:hypothetical protein